MPRFATAVSPVPHGQGIGPLLTGPILSEAGQRRPIENRRHQTVHLRDSCVLSGADVVCAGRFDGDATGAHKGVDDVIDIDIVMGVSAVPIYPEGRPVIMALPRTAITPAAPWGC